MVETCRDGLVCPKRLGPRLAGDDTLSDVEHHESRAGDRPFVSLGHPEKRERPQLGTGDERSTGRTFQPFHGGPRGMSQRFGEPKLNPSRQVKNTRDARTFLDVFEPFARRSQNANCGRRFQFEQLRSRARRRLAGFYQLKTALAYRERVRPHREKVAHVREFAFTM